jgi:5-methylcytosine-specific restriction protein A
MVSSEVRTTRRHTQETKDKIRKTKLGSHVHSESWKRELSYRMKGNTFAVGHKLSEQHKQSIIRAHSGQNSHFFKDGRCSNEGYISWISNRHVVMKKAASGTHTIEEWNHVKQMNANLCAGCGNMEPFIKLTEDHIIPLSKGGSDDISNIQPLCKRCNSRKYNRLVHTSELII